MPRNIRWAVMSGSNLLGWDTPRWLGHGNHWNLWKSWMVWALHSLKLTGVRSLKIGLNAPKGKDRIPTIHFQVRLLLVSGSRVVFPMWCGFNRFLTGRELLQIRSKLLADFSNESRMRISFWAKHGKKNLVISALKSMHPVFTTWDDQEIFKPHCNGRKKDVLSRIDLLEQNHHPSKGVFFTHKKRGEKKSSQKQHKQQQYHHLYTESNPLSFSNGIIYPPNPTDPRWNHFFQGSLPTIFCPHVSRWNLWSWTHQTSVKCDFLETTVLRKRRWRRWLSLENDQTKKTEKQKKTVFWSNSLAHLKRLKIFGAAKSLHSGSVMFIS